MTDFRAELKALIEKLDEKQARYIYHLIKKLFGNARD